MGEGCNVQSALSDQLEECKEHIKIYLRNTTKKIFTSEGMVLRKHLQLDSNICMTMK